MAGAGEAELIEGVVYQLIDEEALGVAFEMHRAIKLGYYELVYPDDSSYEKHDVIDMKGYDIFGNTPQSLQKNVDCLCPNCERTLGATKFAPHLEKCMGMGRNSSRIANRKNNRTPVESDQEGAGVRSEEEEEWVYPERRASKKARKEKLPSSSPHRGSSSRPGPGRPPKNPQPSSSTLTNSTLTLKPSQQQHNVASFLTLSSDHKHSLLQQICGVVSERTGRLCTRSVNCPQHTEDQRQSLRRKLLSDRPVEVSLSSQRRRRERADSSEEGDTHGPSDSPPHLTHGSSDSPPHHIWKRRKLKAGKRAKKSSHGNSSSSMHAGTFSSNLY